MKEKIMERVNEIEDAIAYFSQMMDSMEKLYPKLAESVKIEMVRYAMVDVQGE